jgi:hypothetical protein
MPNFSTALPDLYSLEPRLDSNRSPELSDNRDIVRLGSAERRAPREPTTIGLHARAAEPRFVAATACLHAVRRLFVRTTHGATDA